MKIKKRMHLGASGLNCGTQCLGLCPTWGLLLLGTWIPSSGTKGSAAEASVVVAHGLSGCGSLGLDAPQPVRS